MRSATYEVINDLLQAAARGVFPDDATLAELELPESVAEAIRDAAAPIVAWRGAGMQGRARQEAKSAVTAIVAQIPAGWAPPAVHADPIDEDDPRKLAALVHDGIHRGPDDPRTLAALVPRS